MSIIEKVKEWWERLEEDEQHTMKIIALACVLGVPLVIGLNILFIPYTYPALASLAVTIGILTGIGYAALLLLQFVAPIVLKHYSSEPTVESVAHAAPARGFVPDPKVTVAPRSDVVVDSSLTHEHEITRDQSLQ